MAIRKTRQDGDDNDDKDKEDDDKDTNNHQKKIQSKSFFDFLSRVE